jgi:hypothetical protein
MVDQLIFMRSSSLHSPVSAAGSSAAGSSARLFCSRFFGSWLLGGRCGLGACCEYQGCHQQNKDQKLGCVFHLLLLQYVLRLIGPKLGVTVVNSWFFMFILRHAWVFVLSLARHRYSASEPPPSAETKLPADNSNP